MSHSRNRDRLRNDVRVVCGSSDTALQFPQILRVHPIPSPICVGCIRELNAVFSHLPLPSRIAVAVEVVLPDQLAAAVLNLDLLILRVVPELPSFRVLDNIPRRVIGRPVQFVICGITEGFTIGTSGEHTL